MTKTEGPRAVVAQPRLTELDLLALYDRLTVALQRVSAATRMHQAEGARLHGRGSLYGMRTAWQNATGVLEAAEMSARHAHDQIMAQALTVARRHDRPDQRIPSIHLGHRRPGNPCDQRRSRGAEQAPS